MSTTNSVTSSLMATMNATSSTESSSSTGTSASDIENQFLTLLVAQMKNQDPLNPLENSEVTNQMAQLSTVTGIESLNSTLETLVTDIQSSQALEAANMIGHGVFVPGTGMSLSDSQAILGVELASAADTVKVSIRDSSGNLVHTMNLGEQEAGMLPLAWDGATDAGTTAADGIYTFDVEASIAGETVSTVSLSFGQVNSVTIGSAGVELNLQDMGTVALSDIREIL